jgi:hypothetical protein
MNIVRAIDKNGDWTFGFGLGNYLSGQARFKQNIQTRLFEEIGDCFFNLGAGLNQALYSQKSVLALDLAIRGIIMGTPDFVGIAALTNKLNSSRQVTFTYTVVSIYGPITDQYTFTVQQGSP